MTDIRGLRARMRKGGTVRAFKARQWDRAAKGTGAGTDRGTIDSRVKPEASLPRLVVEKFVELCRKGAFVVGARLPAEHELAEQFGVGRSTIREAMRILEHEGVVQVRQGIGALLAANPDRLNAGSVDIFSDVDLVELVEARYLLEGFVAEVAATVADEAGVARLRAAVERMEHAFSDVDAFYEADVSFHEVLAETTGNRVLSRVMKAVAEALREERQRMMKTLGRTHERTLCTAKEIMAAIDVGDRDRARAAMQEHLEDVRNALTRPGKLG